MGYDGGTLAASGSSLMVIAIIMLTLVLTTVVGIFSKSPVKR